MIDTRGAGGFRRRPSPAALARRLHDHPEAGIRQATPARLAALADRMAGAWRARGGDRRTIAPPPSDLVGPSVSTPLGAGGEQGRPRQPAQQPARGESHFKSSRALERLGAGASQFMPATARAYGLTASHSAPPALGEGRRRWWVL
jgi:hypothetical protein